MDLPTPDRLQLREGLQTVEVLSVERDAEDGDFGPTYRVYVRAAGTVDGKRYIRCGESLYLALYPHLQAGNAHLQIFVSGAGRDRRYGVEAVE